jgi:plastocyanin
VPNQQQININKSTSGSVTFNPNPAAVQTRDQIFWTNNDSAAHWPGLLNPDGSINTTFFMPNQIAPNGDTSASFSPTVAGSFSYACSLHPTEKGTITVT